MPVSETSGPLAPQLAQGDSSRFSARNLSIVCVFAALAVMFAPFWKAAASAWWSDPDYSHGAAMVAIACYLIYQRRASLRLLNLRPSWRGMILVVIGCALQLMGTFSGMLIVSAAALLVIILGIVAVIWSSKHARAVFSALVLLLFTVPWPAYIADEISWRLKEFSTVWSAHILELLGTTVYRQGNILILPNFVLEVKDACSGTRSLFALIAVAVLLATVTKSRMVWRILLVMSAPVLAVIANIFRIVVTGVACDRIGSFAAQETLHTAWGLAVFAISVAMLVGIGRLVQCETS